MQNKNSVKIMGMILLAYFIILLSNVAKQIEEKENIPHMETTIELLDEYTENEYVSDWDILGHNLNTSSTTICDLELQINGQDDLGVYGGGNHFFVERDYRKETEKKSITVGLGEAHYLKIEGEFEEEYTTFYIEDENGRYVTNLEMEKAFGMTTKEVIKFGAEMRKVVEEELENMHTYQINKARKIRGILATIGAIGVALYVLLKGYGIRDGERKKDEYKKHFFLMGFSACFGTYMLRPIISQFVLFWLHGETNRYIAYAISALAVGIVLGVVSQKAVPDLHEEAETKRQIFSRTVLEIMMCTVLIRIGVAIASNFYFYEWKTYLFNFVAAGCAIILCEFIKGKYKMRKEKNEE